MKRIIISIIALCALLCLTIAAYADDKPIHASDLKDGTYEIEVTSSSSMFRIVGCELTVSDGEMTAAMTLSGTGYEKLFMGTGEEALAADDSEYIYFEENADGAYTYTVPVEALNTDTDCAAFSIRKQEWYDRTLVFKSDSLPETAYKAKINKAVIYICAAAVLCTLVTLCVTLYNKKKS